MKVYAWPLCVVAWVLVCRNINDSALAELLTDVGIALITLFFFAKFIFNVRKRFIENRAKKGGVGDTSVGSGSDSSCGSDGGGGGGC